MNHSLRSVSPALRSFRKALPAFAALAAFMLLGVASVSAQPAERPSARKPAPSTAKPARPEKKNDSPAKSADQKKQAEKKAAEKSEKPGDKKAEPRNVDERNSDREAVAKAFAEEHHPELASLLRTLETMNPQAYQAAVRDVARAADRLNSLQERDEERYERELEVWKTRSRVHVVSAEYRVSPGPDLEQKLRELMQDDLQAKRKLLAFERDRAEKRLEQFDRQLRELDEKGSTMIDRQIERLPKVPASIPKSKPNT